MRTEDEIKEEIQLLENSLKKIRKNKNNYHDPQVPIDMIRENLHRIHTLEWVLGQHDRFD